MLCLLFFRCISVRLAESCFNGTPQVFFCVGYSSRGLINEPLCLFFDPIVYEGSSDVRQECHTSLIWDGQLFHMWVHSSVQEEVEEKRFALFPVAVEFFGWIASQLSCESRWPCWGSTASCGDSSSASSTSATASATATATATAKWDGLDCKSCGCRCCRGGLGLCTSHGVGCKNLWGGCNVLPFVGGSVRVGKFSF